MGLTVAGIDGDRNFVGEREGLIEALAVRDDDMFGRAEPPLQELGIAQGRHVPNVPAQKADPDTVDA